MSEPSKQELEEYEKRLQHGVIHRLLTSGTRKRRRVAAAVVAMLLLALYGWRGGPWFIERAKKADVACSDANYGKEPGASLGCEGRAARVVRAEAARWAGDEAGAGAWDERASRLEKLMSTPKRSVLGQLAELD